VPWRGAEHPGDFPTLGYEVADWITENCVIPDGDLVGEPYELTDEMIRFLVWYYRVNPEATSPKTGGQRFHFERGGQLVRPQKWGKGPFSAAVVCAEAYANVVPDGWDAAGEPVGRPWATPHVQITAVSEDQTENVWRVLQPMIELGGLAADIPDTGLTRINLPGGGIIEPVTSSARSRLGQRVTFVVQDETHSWVERNGGWRLADNQRRNLAGMGGRFLETTNAWSPVEQSVAQRTNDAPLGVFVDYPPPLSGSVKNKRERRKVMRQGYGDSWWVDLDRVDVEVEALIAHDPAQAERFFLNRAHAGESLAFDATRWGELATAEVVPDRSLIVVGVDGARFEDALAMVATDVLTGHQWPLIIIQRPELADDDYEHDFEAADGALIEAFERFNVWRVYIDPQRIEKLVERWQGRWNKGSKPVVIEWHTNRPKQICYAVRNYRAAQTAGDLTHDGDSVMAAHIANARKFATNVKDDDGRPMWTLSKDRPGSPNKIDAAMAGVLAWEARGDAIAAGAKPKTGRAVFA
jgi:hypothetical protein